MSKKEQKEIEQLPEVVERIDLLELQVSVEKTERLRAQAEIINRDFDTASRANQQAWLRARTKYKLKDGDTIDNETGKITRK